MNPTLIRLPIGISDFNELIEGKYQFADKTLLIKDIINDGAKVILITRPRRFGKTLNLSMLHYFLQINLPQNEDLFAGLAISREKDFCQEHQNQYPVIFISFKDIKQPTYIESYTKITTLISGLYKNHRYLLEGELLYSDEKEIFNKLINREAIQSDVENSLLFLTDCLFRKFNKSPIILIDEYDTPIQEAYLQGYYTEMVTLMRGILGQALKDNQAIYKAVLTGITRISQESLFSGLNNIGVYSLLREKYGEYFGFSEEEVVKLIAATKQDISLSSIKEWYNGYQIGKHVLYNPWSIINCLDNDGKLQPYWLNTASNDLINKLLSKAKPAVKQQFEKLLQGNIIEQPLSENLVFIDVETKEEALWSLLLYAGYLNVLSTELVNFQLMAKIVVPNKEVSFAYDKIVSEWFSEVVDFRSYLNFTKSLSNGDMIQFKHYLSNYIMQSGSYFDFNSNTHEQIFHIFILGLVVGMRDEYIINSNHESGLGRFDVIFLPKDKQKNGIVLEFKTSSTEELLLVKAEEALSQINTKEYVTIFKQHDIPSALAIGMSFCGKKMELVHETLKC